MMQRSSSGETFGLSRLGAIGSSVMIEVKTMPVVLPVNGWAPVTIP